jgi:hypothetical protein
LAVDSHPCGARLCGKLLGELCRRRRRRPREVHLERPISLLTKTVKDSERHARLADPAVLQEQRMLL